ncbi:hypothetical protein CCMSSC00406_0009103 [Pleurotus cornucopiae]|uniref:Uncharacterized protein n=1 Tax=Pleurotus cornucopiae TaxID=5321 RepID=A0ACB7J7P9_PLECO|nr:hypothetical protein CCMSSC00406_0009103 [Pleurotus cornucopiae]
MSFANASDFSIHDSTFNDIAGDQYIYANHYHITRYRSTPGRPFTGRDPIPHFDNDAPIPTTSPYSDLIAIIEDIQYTLFPLDALMSRTRLFGPLQQQLAELRLSAAFAGCIAELLEGTKVWPTSWFEAVRSRVGHYHSALSIFYDQIENYRRGLEFSLIGPLWRSVLSFLLWRTGDPDIQTIIRRMATELEQFRQPLEQILILFHKYMNTNGYRRDFDLQTFERIRRTLGFHIPSLKDVRLEYVTIKEGKQAVSIPISFCSSWEGFTHIYILESSYIPRPHERYFALLAAPGVSEFTQISGAAEIRMANWDYQGCIFFENDISICPACGHRCDELPGKSPEDEWVVCWECRAEYTTRVCAQRKSSDIRQDEISWLRNASDSSLLSTCIFPQLPAKDEFESQVVIASRFIKEGLPICASYYLAWEELAACDVLANVTATPDTTRDLLYVLDRIQSPLRRVSVHFGRGDDSPVVVPARYRWSFNNQCGALLELPLLDSLRVEAKTLDLLDEFVCRLSIPPLRDLECQFEWGRDYYDECADGWGWTAGDVQDWGEKGRKDYEALRAFILRSEQLRTLRLSTKFRVALLVQCEIDLRAQKFPSVSSMGTVNTHSLTWSRRQILPQLRLFADLLPNLCHLECLAIRGIWEIPVLFRGIIPFPLSTPALIREVRRARRAFGKLRALRLEYECHVHVYWRSVEELPRGFTHEYVAGLARLIRSWHAEPWVFCEDFEFVRDPSPDKRSTCIWKWSVTLPLETVDEAPDPEDAAEGCDLPHDGLPRIHRDPLAVSLTDLPNILHDDKFGQDEDDS